MRQVLLAGLALVVITSCFSTTVDSRHEQAWALGDGTATQAEYHTAVERFISCMHDAGHGSTEPIVSPIDGLTLLYDIVPDGDPVAWNETIEACNARHLSHIEPAYVESQEHVMDVSLRQGTVDCLMRQGVTLSGHERNVTDFVTAAGGRTPMVLSCVINTARALFPKLPSDVKILY